MAPSELNPCYTKVRISGKGIVVNAKLDCVTCPKTQTTFFGERTSAIKAARDEVLKSCRLRPQDPPPTPPQI